MTPDHYRIRRATNADCAAVQAIVFAALREHGLTPEPDATDADLFDFDQHYITRGGCFHVITDAAGIVVGSVGLYPIDARTIELRKMYLSPEHRGRGLGKRLL